MTDANFIFDPDKNAWLKEHRGISFEEIISFIAEGGLLDVVEHSNPRKYPNQQMYVVDCNGYVHLVLFERKDGHIHLKTIYPSRKATRDYLK